MMPNNIFKKRASLRRQSFHYSSEISAGEKGAIINALDKLCGSKDARYVLLGWLFDQETDMSPFERKSSKKLTIGQWSALKDWAKITKNEETNEWLPCEQFQTDITLMCKVVIPLYDNLLTMNLSDDMTDLLTALGGVRKD